LSVSVSTPPARELRSDPLVVVLDAMRRRL
jgi:hypothetical protein